MRMSLYVYTDMHPALCNVNAASVNINETDHCSVSQNAHAVLLLSLSDGTYWCTTYVMYLSLYVHDNMYFHALVSVCQIVYVFVCVCVCVCVDWLDIEMINHAQ